MNDIENMLGGGSGGYISREFFFFFLKQPGIDEWMRYIHVPTKYSQTEAIEDNI